MESTPTPQSGNKPHEHAESAAAVKDGKGDGEPLDGGPPPVAPAADTDVKSSGSDTQELSAAEIADLISADDDPPQDAGPLKPAAESRATGEAPGYRPAAGGAEPPGDEEVPVEAGAATRSVNVARPGLWAIGLVVLLAVTVAVGSLYLGRRPPSETPADRRPITGTPLKHPPPTASTVKVPGAAPGLCPPADSLLERLTAQQDRLDVLRDRMLAKADEITRLQQHYRESVGRIEDTVLSEKSHAGIDSLKQALATRRIALQLETIRRRKAYIDCLDEPVDRLRRGSEAVLFLKRKHRLQALVHPFCRLIDPAKLIAENDVALAAYTRSAETVTVDLQKASFPDLDQIWQGLIEKEKEAGSNGHPTAAGTLRTLGSKAQANNQLIWREICEEQWTRKGELTTLTVDAADCLTRWKEPDLFLNGITHLSREAARRLFKWRGTWFCLNGLNELSPETAPYLFNWQGEWLSLNGLKHLDPEASIFLANWKGRTLELTGLSPALMEAEVVALKHLAHWQKSGGRLHVSERVRQLIEEAMR